MVVWQTPRCFKGKTAFYLDQRGDCRSRKHEFDGWLNKIISFDMYGTSTDVAHYGGNTMTFETEPLVRPER